MAATLELKCLSSGARAGDFTVKQCLPVKPVRNVCILYKGLIEHLVSVLEFFFLTSTVFIVLKLFSSPDTFQTAHLAIFLDLLFNELALMSLLTCFQLSPAHPSPSHPSLPGLFSFSTCFILSIIPIHIFASFFHFSFYCVSILEPILLLWSWIASSNS